MPSVKQGGGYTLTFAKKNQDVKLILDEKKKNKVVVTDYICEAIRFFEQNKNKEFNNSIVSNADIDKLIEDKIKALIGNNIQEVKEEILVEENIDTTVNLEDDYGINDSDLEED
ncbi:hypothetical protein [uncultured Tyzzerella sp.]|uniref:hypothetical protein n=1 Tax=uncultured Tyzzerella sp. TaxID=2321398 RepID=UPI0029420F4E|nr:hypothetical protein [uncultured Tyzzerella sp.]